MGCPHFPLRSGGLQGGNGESAFKELLETTIADTVTPWEWQGYVPYDHERK
jgi:hypothetical protein